MTMTLSWSEVENCCRYIADTVSDQDIGTIVPIVRGGMIPSVIISEMLGIKRVSPISLQTRDGNPDKESLSQWSRLINVNRRILVVEDIVDSGKTLNILRGVCKSDTPANIIYSALVVNQDADEYEYPLDDIVRAITIKKRITPDMWIVFPWDKRED